MPNVGAADQQHCDTRGQAARVQHGRRLPGAPDLPGPGWYMLGRWECGARCFRIHNDRDLHAWTVSLHLGSLDMRGRPRLRELALPVCEGWRIWFVLWIWPGLRSGRDLPSAPAANLRDNSHHELHAQAYRLRRRSGLPDGLDLLGSLEPRRCPRPGVPSRPTRRAYPTESSSRRKAMLRAGFRSERLRERPLGARRAPGPSALAKLTQLPHARRINRVMEPSPLEQGFSASGNPPCHPGFREAGSVRRI
jgi:hypothetical protein